MRLDLQFPLVQRPPEIFHPSIQYEVTCEFYKELELTPFTDFRPLTCLSIFQPQ